VICGSDTSQLTEEATHMPVLSLALRERWRPALTAGLLVLALCLLGGFLYPREFTAQSQVIAGQVGVAAAAVPAYAVAGESLAQTFSRVFSGDAVQTRIAQDLGPDEYKRVSLSASPIPGTSIILLEAKASTSRGAQQAADVAATVLTDEVRSLLSSADALEETSRRFAEASQRLLRAQSDLDQAKAQLEAAASRSDDASTTTAQGLVAERMAAAAVAQAEVDALQSDINDGASSAEPANAVQLLASGQVVDDNNLRRFQVLGLTGLLLGSVAASLIAYTLFQRGKPVSPHTRRRRTLRSAQPITAETTGAGPLE
jgi:exonuclease VII small subunit